MTATDQFLPLSPRAFHILLALSAGPRNGYRIMLDVEENSEGQVRIGPGTLYEGLHRMREQGLIEPVSNGDTEVDGRNQRFYRLTTLGRNVLRAEATRLVSDVRLARANHVLSDEDV